MDFVEHCCGDVQESFGVTIDVALERALQPIRNMFGTASGRGNPGPVLRGLQASSGEIIDLEPGWQPRLHEPVVQVTRRSECRFDVHIKLDNFAQLGWAAHLLKLQLPQASIDESMLRAAATPVQALNRWC